MCRRSLSQVCTIASPLIFQSLFTFQLIIQSYVTSQLIIQSHTVSQLFIQSDVKSQLIIQSHTTSQMIIQSPVMSVTPRYSRSVLRFPSLVSSVRDAPLVSACAAGIPKPTHFSPPVPDLIPLSVVLPTMGIAL